MDFVDFVVKYWKYISIGLVIFINLLLFIFKKKPVANIEDRFLYDVLSQIPSWIVEAEERFDDGKEKLAWVLHQVYLYASHSGLTDSELGIYTPLFTQYIERILSTPQKKGK